MTPNGLNGGNMPYACVYGVQASDSPGVVRWFDISDTIAVRPVISLKSCVKYSSGDGSSGSPYTIFLDSDISC